VATIEQKILRSLEAGPAHIGHIAREAGLDEIRTLAWMNTLRSEGLVCGDYAGPYRLTDEAIEEGKTA